MALTNRCPVSHAIPWLERDFQSDPYAVLLPYREESPVFYEPELDHYVVTRYDDIEHVLLDRDTFAAANASAPLWPPCPEAQAILAAEGYKRVPTLNNSDPPRHGPMRRAVFTCMSRARIRGLEPSVREYALELVGGLIDTPVADLVKDLAYPLPAHAGLGLLGVPEADIEMIKAWGDRRVLMTYGHLSPADQIEVAHNVGAFWRYVEGFVAERDADRSDDLTSDLLAYKDDHSDEVTVEDVVNMVYAMALAGHESTTNAISSGLRHLLAHRDQWDALVADRSLIPNAVEECLRFDPPVLGHRRITTRDTEISGVSLPQGARVIMLFGSAHRDPGHFDDPVAFDVRRANANTHLSFGKGVHFCLGAPLARMELQIVLELLTEQAPHLRLVADQSFPYAGNAMWRTLSELLAEPRPHTRTDATGVAIESAPRTASA
jgi:cytochrome P450